MLAATWAASDVSMLVSGTSNVWGRVAVRRVTLVARGAGCCFCSFGAETDDSLALAVTSIGRATFFALAARVSTGFAACGFATTGSGATPTAGTAASGAKRSGAFRRVTFGARSVPTVVFVAAAFLAFTTAGFFARTVFVAV